MEKSNKIAICIIVFFAILAATITAVLIFTNNSKSGNINDGGSIVPSNNENKDSDEAFERIKLTDTYNENNIKYEIIEENTENINSKYVKINGLKDKTIENKINAILKEKVRNMVETTVNGLDESFEGVYIYSGVASNFSNILSVYVSGYVDPYTLEFNIPSIGINIDLTTGNLIKLQDLFYDEEKFYTSIRKQIYNSLVGEIAGKELWLYEGDENYLETLGEIEEQKISLEEDVLERYLGAREYLKKDVNFYFYSNYIVFEDKEMSKNIYGFDMQEDYENVAIYTRFLTDESIFENDNIGQKNRFVFSNYSEKGYYNYQGKILDNLYVYVSIYNTNYGENEEKLNILESLKGKYIAKVEEIKKQIKNDDEMAKVIIINCAYNNLDDNYALSCIREDIKEYSMEKKYYDETFLNLIAETSRNDYMGMMNGKFNLYLDDETKNSVNEVAKYEEYFWNTKNNTKVENVKDIFKNEEELKTAMNTYLKEKWQEKYGVELTDDELYEKNKLTTLEILPYVWYGENGTEHENVIVFKNSELGSHLNMHGYYDNYNIPFSYFGISILNIVK